MIIQHNGNYKLQAVVQWIDADQLKVQLRRTDLGIEYTDCEFYLTPTELATLADYINDTLAR